MDETKPTTRTAGTGGASHRTSHGAASRRRRGSISRSRRSGGMKRPIVMSPTSMPAAVAAKRKPAWWVSGTNRASHPTIRPFGTHMHMYTGRVTGEVRSVWLRLRVRATTPRSGVDAGRSAIPHQIVRTSTTSMMAARPNNCPAVTHAMSSPPTPYPAIWKIPTAALMVERPSRNPSSPRISARRRCVVPAVADPIK